MITRLYIGNLHQSATDQVLRDTFESIGPVKRAEVVVDKRLRQSRGFAFVEMEEPKDLERAVTQLNGRNLMGRPMKVQAAMTSRRGPLRAG